MVSDQKHDATRAVSQWLRIPDGTMVQHRLDGQKGHIDGLLRLLQGRAGILMVGLSIESMLARETGC